MSYKNPTFKAFNKQAILITWDEIIDENLLKFILQYKKIIQQNWLKEKVEVINTYNSLLINYTFTIKNLYDEISSLKSLLKDVEISNMLKVNQFTIPVCYDVKFGMDLKEISNKNHLEISQIIALHTQPNYTVFFTGFLPGFLYLGGLQKELYISRKKSPRLDVKKGAVGIGEKQTGIYPQNSAGGWQIIGNSPLCFFDASKKNPSPFQGGDKLKFESISLKEYEEIKKEVGNNSYQFQTEIYEY
ncbi:5-oxoprolinase subunit PxpB [Mesonia maritima]|uniref:Inhibitor of KinA n=1 Tax=Mesonia maritima TaxID=1793873 RepID=A0ABU1K658_9FLAO|nr:5-oxoprolinase subunit PxpB [Mesonia maritima]MDR6301099.1 inhibitor of KinA [Mesonia maritima]